MGLNGCMNCVRWFVFVLNLLFWLAGMGVLGVALWLRLDPDVAAYMQIHTDLHHFYIGVYILIGVGALMTIMGFLGCCGAWRKSPCMLISFSILLIVVFIAELTAGVMAYVHQETVSGYVEKSMRDTLVQHYGREGKEAYTEVIDQLQEALHCCGVRSYRDWRDANLGPKPTSDSETAGILPELSPMIGDRSKFPRSCCNEFGLQSYPQDCGDGFDRQPMDSYQRFLHEKGCHEALYQKLYNSLHIIVGVAVGIGCFQLIGILFSVALCCWIGQGSEREYKSY